MSDSTTDLVVFSIPQIAKLLQVNIETVRRLIRSGELKGFKVGSGWRITQADLQQFIKCSRPVRCE